jgi:spore coat protein U-like protein
VKKSVIICALSILVMGSLASVAHAGSATSSFNVTAQVVQSCTISTVPLGFGNYDPIVANLSTALQVNGSVTITCTKGSSTTIGLDPGQNASHAVGTTRAMAQGVVDYLSYELYQDVGHATVWGNSGVALFTPPVAPSKAARTYTIYGSVPPAQSSTTGAYTDSVVATVNF